MTTNSFVFNSRNWADYTHQPITFISND